MSRRGTSVPVIVVRAQRSAQWLSAVVAASAFALAASSATYVGTASDTSAYVAIARMWQRGSLVAPEPLQLLPRLSAPRELGSPLGFRPGPISGTMVPAYPAGWPLIMAAAATITADPYSVHLVAPALFGALVAVASALVACAGKGFGGVLSAALIAGSPLVFYHAMHPMSDVPATALWALAWWMALRSTVSSAVASGLCMLLAVLVRPNLAPLSLALLVLFLPESKRRAGAAAYAPAAIAAGLVAAGVCLQLWLQHQIYGSYWASSYPNASALFSLSYFRQNVSNYSGMVRAQIGWPALLLLVLWVGAATRDREAAARRLVCSGLGLMLINGLLYACYRPYSDWPSLRFLMPALVAGAVVAGSGWQHTVSSTRGLARAMVLAAGIATPVLSMTARPDQWQYALDAWFDHRRLIAMASYLNDALPKNAVIMGFVHTGLLQDATGRSIARLDWVAPEALDGLVAALGQAGLAPVFVLDGQIETRQFSERYAQAAIGNVSWRPRARFVAALEASVWLATDASRQQSYSTDVIRHRRPR